jgi:hypothetical protein
MGGVRIYDRSRPTSLWLAAQGEPEALAPDGDSFLPTDASPNPATGRPVRWSRYTGTVQRLMLHLHIPGACIPTAIVYR